MEIFHDITDIKKTQEALQFANKKLNLMAEVTRHDIKNKLTVMSGYLELFKDHPPEPQHSMYLKKLQDTVATIRTTIEFTRLYQDLGVVAPEWNDVYNLFFMACTRIDLKKIRVLSDVHGLEIFADPLLERVFFNLVDNAVRHGNRVSEIKLTASRFPEKLVLKVEDNGIGILPQDKEKIFSKGFGKNTGLGLFLAREILSITSMTIYETGQYQQGCCFEIHVPKGGFRSASKVLFQPSDHLTLNGDAGKKSLSG
jgi:signal transduction histidine kinase